LSQPNPQVPRPRIQGLSDLIFGLALSIGAIQFVGNLPKDAGALNSDLATFAFSFLILINVWNRYTSTASVMPVETGWMVRLNMVLLFLVAVEPFLFDVMVVQGLSTSAGQAASVYYGFDIGGMNLVLAYFTHILTREEKNLIPRELINKYKVTRDVLLSAAAVFLVADLPFFSAIGPGGEPLRVDLWLLSLPLIWVPRLVGERLHRRHA
jgi:uncharacterized membrane protein